MKKSIETLKVVDGWPFKVTVSSGFKLNLLFAGGLRLRKVIFDSGFKVFNGGTVSQVVIYRFKFWEVNKQTIVVESLEVAAPSELQLPTQIGVSNSVLSQTIISNIPSPAFQVREENPRMKLVTRIIPRINGSFTPQWNSPAVNSVRINLKNQLTIKPPSNVNTRTTE